MSTSNIVFWLAGVPCNSVGSLSRLSGSGFGVLRAKGSGLHVFWVSRFQGLGYSGCVVWGLGILSEA